MTGGTLETRRSTRAFLNAMLNSDTIEMSWCSPAIFSIRRIPRPMLPFRQSRYPNE